MYKYKEKFNPMINNSSSLPHKKEMFPNLLAYVLQKQGHIVVFFRVVKDFKYTEAILVTAWL